MPFLVNTTDEAITETIEDETFTFLPGVRVLVRGRVFKSLRTNPALRVGMPRPE